MEVVGAYVCGGDIERLDALSFDVDDAVLVLHMPCDKQKSAARDDHPVTLKNIRRENHVGDASFIFKREEDEAFGCAGTLAGDDAPGDADRAIVAAAQQVVLLKECLRGAGPRDDRPWDAGRW